MGRQLQWEFHLHIHKLKAFATNRKTRASLKSRCEANGPTVAVFFCSQSLLPHAQLYQHWPWKYQAWRPLNGTVFPYLANAVPFVANVTQRATSVGFPVHKGSYHAQKFFHFHWSLTDLLVVHLLALHLTIIRPAFVNSFSPNRHKVIVVFRITGPHTDWTSIGTASLLPYCTTQSPKRG